MTISIAKKTKHTPITAKDKNSNRFLCPSICPLRHCFIPITMTEIMVKNAKKTATMSTIKLYSPVEFNKPYNFEKITAIPVKAERMMGGNKYFLSPRRNLKA